MTSSSSTDSAKRWSIFGSLNKHLGFAGSCSILKRNCLRGFPSTRARVPIVILTLIVVVFCRKPDSPHSSSAHGEVRHLRGQLERPPTFLHQVPLRPSQNVANGTGFRLSPVNPRAIYLNTLIEQVISLQATGVRDKGVAIVGDVNPDLPSTFAEAVQIQQVLFNLLVDADDSMSRSEKPKKLPRGPISPMVTLASSRKQQWLCHQCGLSARSSCRGQIKANSRGSGISRSVIARSKLFDEKEE
jgi:hypothetical protein